MSHNNDLLSYTQELEKYLKQNRLWGSNIPTASSLAYLISDNVELFNDDKFKDKFKETYLKTCFNDAEEMISWLYSCNQAIINFAQNDKQRFDDNDVVVYSLANPNKEVLGSTFFKYRDCKQDLKKICELLNVITTNYELLDIQFKDFVNRKLQVGWVNILTYLEMVIGVMV